MDKIYVVKLTSCDRYGRDNSYYPCENEKVALKKYNQLRNEFLARISEETQNDFIKGADNDDGHIYAHSVDYDHWFEIEIVQQEILKAEDICPDYVIKYGRQWESARIKHNLADYDWWLVCTSDEMGEMHCNNKTGTLLLIEPNGSRWESVI